MDLRIVKTERAIREAFLALRKEMPLEKVKVHDICQLALINKTTFYSHYTDVFALSDRLEEDFIARLTEMEQPELLFRNPEQFLDAMHIAIRDNYAEGAALFGGRIQNFFGKYNARLVKVFQEKGLSHQINALRFVMGGLASTRFAFGSEDELPDPMLRRQIVSFITAVGKTLE